MTSVQPSRIADFLRYRALRARMVWYRLVEDDYSDAYERLMQYRVAAHGPDAATGEKPAGAGLQQLGFLASIGVRPDHRVLDFGCGSGRLARHLVPYLEAGNYVGADISAEVLATAAGRLDGVDGASEARLVCNDGCSLAFLDREVDVIWAHSVATHLPPDDLRTLFASVPGAVREGGCLLASYFPEERASPKDHGYPPDDLGSIADQAGVEVRTVGPDRYPNPHDHSLLCVTAPGAPTRFWPPDRPREQADTLGAQINRAPIHPESKRYPMEVSDG